MSLGHGAKIVRDGLVFYYDMDNTAKSWKGKPTTNLFTNPTNLGVSPWVRNNTSWNTTTKKASITSNTAGNYFLQDKPLTAGLEYTLSIEAKAETAHILQMTPSTGFTISDYGNFDLRDGSIGGSAGGQSKMSAVHLGDNWYRVSYTDTATATGNGRIAFAIGDDINYSRLSTAGGLSVGNGILIRATQMEQNNFATPFVNGTRSNTESIIDLTGNETITISDLTYNSNNTFEFDGTNNTGMSIPSIDFSSEQTIEIWLKPTENDSVRRNPYNQAYGGYGTWTHEPSGYINYYYGNAGGNATPYTSRGSAYVGQNEIACMCVTRDINTVSWYKNGILSNSAANAYGVLANTSSDITIGSGYAGKYFGNIYSVKLYNKALTANEVKQNFNAMRGRYGL